MRSNAPDPNRLLREVCSELAVVKSERDAARLMVCVLICIVGVLTAALLLQAL